MFAGELPLGSSNKEIMEIKTLSTVCAGDQVSLSGSSLVGSPLGAIWKYTIYHHDKHLDDIMQVNRKLGGEKGKS